METGKNYVDKIFTLAKLALTFAKVNRATHHEDGARLESDTDHTFMLSIIACSMANTFYKYKLDIGLVSQFATVHDLVEVYAGDTNSFINVSEEAREAKRKIEQSALKKIKSELDPEFIWAAELITRYEEQSEQEARFVKLVDKLMPELTHILANFSYIKASGMGKDYYCSFIKNKLVTLNEKYGVEFPEMLDLFRSISEISIKQCQELQ